MGAGHLTLFDSFVSPSQNEINQFSSLVVYAPKVEAEELLAPSNELHH